MKIKKLVVLLAEDDDDDILLFRLAVAKCQADIAMHVVRDGTEAVAYLSGEGRYADRDEYPFPTVLLLDNKMPQRSGLDVLKWRASHPEYSVIPTIFFSSSDKPDDIREAYELRVNAYFKKPSTHHELVKLLDGVFFFWCKAQVPKLPNDENGA